MGTVKLFISHILSHSEFHDGVATIFKKPIQYVWIQGIVLELNEETKEIVLDDGTGAIFVSMENSSKEFTGTSADTIGKYFMIQGTVVLGEIEEEQESVVFIEARLFYDLSYDLNLEALWQYEVMEVVSMVFEKNC
jgi:RNase P/RNase MRP subunit p29